MSVKKKAVCSNAYLQIQHKPDSNTCICQFKKTYTNQDTRISRYPLYYRWTILIFNISNFSVLIGCFATGPGGINAITHGLQSYPHKTRSMTLLWRLMCLFRLRDLTRCFFFLGILFSSIIFNAYYFQESKLTTWTNKYIKPNLETLTNHIFSERLVLSSMTEVCEWSSVPVSPLGWSSIKSGSAGCCPLSENWHASYLLSLIWCIRLQAVIL